jgi:hypothetical protein
MPRLPIYPPVGFCVFGLDEDWAKGRWLEMIEGSSEVAYGLRLGHGDRHRPLPGRPWAMVTSWDMPRLHGPSTHYSIDAAQRAVLGLLEMTRPNLTKHERTRFIRKMLELSRSEGDRYAMWPTVVWVIDDQPVDAHVFYWAGAWTAFAMLGDVAVEVAGVQVTPEDLRLRTQTDALRYHFDLLEPLVYPDAITQSQAHAPVRADEDRIGWPRHPDHEQLFIEN